MFTKITSFGLIFCIFISSSGMALRQVGPRRVLNSPVVSRLDTNAGRRLTDRGAAINPVGMTQGSRQRATVVIEQCTSTDGDSISIVNRDQLKNDGIEVISPVKVNKCTFQLQIAVDSKSGAGVARRIEFNSTTERGYVDLTILAGGIAAGRQNQSGETNSEVVPDDVIIGEPQPIPYSQAFPLLDGLFQDVSAIQINALNLDANAANANRLDALIQQFQFALQYSQTLGLQNSSAAQQNASFSTYQTLQMQLTNQESQLIDQSLVAQQQVLQAQKALDSLPSTATADDKAAATQTLALANDELTSINARITSVKNLIATTAPSAPTFSAPAPTPPTAPTPLVTPSLPLGSSGSPFQPNFPASKQMENQVNLLWERLANLVSTLAQTNNPANIYLVKFDTGILSGDKRRNRQLLTTQYSLQCGNSTATDGSNAPKVLDLFPRKSAVNIADEKYRNSRLNLAAMLSFFSIGANAAYNREHLQITQALGQSAYITGYGIQTNSFGWVFGRSLGEDAPAPGDRTTFALVSFPESCDDPKINLIHAGWGKSPSTVSANNSNALRAFDVAGTKPNDEPRCKDCTVEVAYTPGEFDPANPSSTSKVTVDVTLSSDLDREETVSVNGNIISRARDTFGRATLKNPAAANAIAGGSGGLLESATLDAGTWLPVRSKEIILNLSPSVYTGRFPSIILNSPKGSIDITNSITSAKISGIDYICPPAKGVPNATPCASVLPAIGRPRSTPKNFFIGRWQGKNSYHVVIKSLDDTKPAASSTNGSGLPSIQVLRGSDQPWSAHATVVATQDNEKAYPLKCRPSGEYLDCDAGPINRQQRIRSGAAGDYDPMAQTEFEIFDADYAGGPAKGAGLLQGCTGGGCYSPLIWENDQPRWVGEDGEQIQLGGQVKSISSSWVFHMVLANVHKGQQATLDGNFPADIQCPTAQRNIDEPECTADFIIPKDDFSNVKDLMFFSVRDAATHTPIPDAHPTAITNLRLHISPLISDISDDQMHFTGQNLVFEEITVGPTGNPIKIKCDKLGLDCYVPDKPGYGKDEGYLYFKAGDTHVEFVQVDAKGIHPVTAHHPKPKENGQAETKTSTKTVPQNVQAPSDLLRNDLRFRITTSPQQ